MIAKSFARIHWQNLVNFGVLPLTFVYAVDYDRIELNDELAIDGVRKALTAGRRTFALRNVTRGLDLEVEHGLSERQVRILLAGGLINDVRTRRIG